MIKYKFENFNEPIEAETVELKQIVDYCNGRASVTILLTDKGGNEYGYNLEEAHKYTKDLAKSEVLTWVNNELKKYEV